MKKGNGWSVLGILAGIIIIIFGIVVLNKKIKFGGDFYTEIYQLVRLGFGFLLISIGMTDIIMFGRNFYDYEKLPENENNVSESKQAKNESDDTLPYIWNDLFNNLGGRYNGREI